MPVNRPIKLLIWCPLSLFEYVPGRRVRVRLIIDATMVCIRRHIRVERFHRKLHADSVAARSGLLPAVRLVRFNAPQLMQFLID